jgi:uncharacterized protein HemX
MTAHMNGWLKVILSVLVPLILGAVGYGILRSDVRHNSSQVERVEQQSALARSQLEFRVEARLMRIEDKLDRLIELRLMPR